MMVIEAARRMGVARQSVDLWLEKGKLPFRVIYNSEGRPVRDITLGDLMDFDREWSRQR
jgi:predicted site-specific integrase-resolvase